MKLKSRGVSRVIPVVILIVIVVVAVIAYYSVSSAPKTSSTSTAGSTSQSSTTSSTPATTSSTVSSTSTSSSVFSSQSTTLSSTTSSMANTTTSPAACITTSPSNSSEGQAMVGWFGNYSSLSISFTGTKNGKTRDLNFAYSVVYKSPTTYKVSLNFLINSKARTATIWVLNNGTILAYYASTGVNYTGSTASNTVLGYFADLESLDIMALQSTNTAYFHSNGTSTATIGPNSFPVTNYVLNTTPETIQGCNNSGYATLSSSSVNLGTPSGSSFELVESANFVGSFTTASGTEAVDYTYQVTALTVA